MKRSAISLEEAIHRLSGLPATNLGLEGRGFLEEGMFGRALRGPGAARAGAR